MASESKRRRLAADDVLADTVRPRPAAEELAELIQRVNPTGLQLAPAEERRRYRVKAALQSLLLRRHPELVALSSEDGALLEIALVGTGRHAAHVPLDELDEDVRAWARRALLDEGDSVTRADPIAAPVGGRDPLTAGREARDRGAFEDAQSLFEEALTASTGRAARIAVAVELLDLLVGSLWDDKGALEVAHRLRHEPEVLASSSVRAPIALAAARSGDLPRARALLADAAGGHAIAAWAELGMAALAETNADDMRRVLDRLSALDPMHPTAGELRSGLESIARDENARTEAALEQRLRDVAPDAMEPIAREHLRRWPKSAVAQEVLTRADAARREQRIATLLARADASYDATARLAALRSARSEGAAGLDEQIVELERTIDAADLARARSDLALVLSSGDEERALEAWLDAAVHVRAGLALSSLLTRAEELAVLTSARRTADKARAAIACARAEQQEARGNLDAASSVLSAGGRFAAEIGETLQLSQRIESARARDREQSVRATLEAAEAALSAGDEARAQALLGGLARGPGRELAERITRARQVRLEVARFEALRSAGNLPEARFVALGLRSHDEARWRAELEKIDEETPRCFQLECGDDAIDVAEFADRIGQAHERVVSPDGRELALVNGTVGAVFIRILDVDSGLVVRHAHLRHPRPGSGSYVTHVVFDGEHLRWGTQDGLLFALHQSLRRDLVVTSLSSFAPEGTVLEDLLPIPGGRTVWLAVRPMRAGEHRAIVVDLERGRVVREIDDVTDVSLAAGEGEPRVLQLKAGAAHVHDGSGQRIAGIRLSGPRFPLGGDMAGDRLHILYEQDEEGADELSLRWSVTTEAKFDRRWCGVLGADPDAPSNVVAMGPRDALISFRDDDHWRTASVEVVPGRTAKPTPETNAALVAWRAIDPMDDMASTKRVQLRAECMRLQGFFVHWDVPSARDVLIGTNLRGDSTVAVVFEPTPKVVRISATEAPRLDAPDEDNFALWAPWWLERRPQLPGEATEKLVYRPFVMGGEDDVFTDDLYVPGRALAFADEHRQDSKVVRARIEETAKRHPTSASVLAELVELLVRADSFAEARPWVDRLLELPVPSDVAVWGERARALIALRSFDVERALASWRWLLANVEPDDRRDSTLRLGLAAYEGRGQGRLQALLDAMEHSDECRARGDVVGAITALDIAAVWLSREGHALARLADLWLERRASTAAERFKRTRVLSMAATGLVGELKMPPRTDVWPLARIEDVARRSRASLASVTA